MASQKNIVILQNPKTGTTYRTSRHHKKFANAPKLELKKYDPKTGKHEVFKQVKKESKLKKNK